MNHWTKLSIELANQRDYLDQLFKVYPLVPETFRVIDDKKWQKVEKSFNAKNNTEFIRNLLELPLFPIKDSYVAYLRRDKTAIDRNPATINRIVGRLYEMGLDKVWGRVSEPKETNRQIGPLFRRWVRNKSLGLYPVKLDDFTKNNDNAILDASDAEMMLFARDNLNYRHDKGLDFVARFSGKYVIGEAKFLTDFGGHQNAQFNDAISVLQVKDVNAVTVAILDGVLYITSSGKMYSYVNGSLKGTNIMSSLVLREFLYQL